MVSIRPATRNDLSAVLPMVRSIGQLHADWDPQRYALSGDIGSRYEPWLRRQVDNPRAVFLVGERESDSAREMPRLVAFLIATAEQEQVPIYQVREFGFIHDLWVDEPYRHEGIARQMVILAVERFGAMGIRQARLEAWHGNDAAIGLFESCGFRASTVQMLLEME